MERKEGARKQTCRGAFSRELKGGKVERGPRPAARLWSRPAAALVRPTETPLRLGLLWCERLRRGKRLLVTRSGGERPSADGVRIGPEDEGKKEEVVVLGIETSCDDTGVALVSTGGRIVCEALSSSLPLHRREGGVVPHIARREHEHHLPLLLDDVLRRCSMPHGVAAIAVTAGPGLALCLNVGLERARQLAIEHNLPFIAVNHLEAHALVARLAEPRLEFPFLVCLVSGGHTQLLYANDVNDYLLLGGTLDDSLGEAYDKIARLLDIKPTRENEPAGEMLERVAREGRPDAFPFVVPMAKQKNCDFSFSGLKTQIVRRVHALGGAETLDQQQKADLAASFQKTAVRHLHDRIERALEWCRTARSDKRLSGLVVCGGVARNLLIRKAVEELAHGYQVEAIFPPLPLCTDNGVMVAWAGIERLRRGLVDDAHSVRFHPRWPLDRSGALTNMEVFPGLPYKRPHKSTLYDP